MAASQSDCQFLLTIISGSPPSPDNSLQTLLGPFHRWGWLLAVAHLSSQHLRGKDVKQQVLCSTFLTKSNYFPRNIWKILPLKTKQTKTHFLGKSHLGACPTPCRRLRAVRHPRGPAGRGAGRSFHPGRAPDWPARPAGVTASRSPAASGSLVGAQRAWPAAGSGSPATRERARPAGAARAGTSAERGASALASPGVSGRAAEPGGICVSLKRGNS
ncbi:uncharacterized protein LOC118577911 [Onychomys torridus]|uniref:uncharacterized protein LOC118577911 n=1 Tax=Onychomys torridus TaxID=38674 RepID=UPI00167FDB31|nr:uncharacterized protein LOC118577911 [Onychomys torridus]